MRAFRIYNTIAMQIYYTRKNVLYVIDLSLYISFVLCIDGWKIHNYYTFIVILIGCIELGHYHCGLTYDANRLITIKTSSIFYSNKFVHLSIMKSIYI